MLIHSRIDETDTTISYMQVAGPWRPDAPVRYETELHSLGAHGQARSTKLATDGLCMLEVSFDLQRAITDQFTIDVEHVHLSFFFQGDSRVSGLTDLPAFKLDEGLMRAHFQQSIQVDVVMQPGEPVRYVSIALSRAYFLALVGGEPWTKGNPLIDAVVARRHFQLDQGALLINHPVLAIVHQLFDTQYLATLAPYERSFVDLKLKELIFLFHVQYQTRHPVRHNLDSDTTAALEKAKALLTANFAHPPTIPQLSREVSLNEQKLKQEFKRVFNTTIYGYVLQLRMAEAARLVHHPDYAVNQLAVHLGYNSVSHFIVAFKKYYGCTPRQAAHQKIRLNRVMDR